MIQRVLTFYAYLTDERILGPHKTVNPIVCKEMEIVVEMQVAEPTA